MNSGLRSASPILKCIMARSRDWDGKVFLCGFNSQPLRLFTVAANDHLVNEEVIASGGAGCLLALGTRADGALLYSWQGDQGRVFIIRPAAPQPRLSVALSVRYSPTCGGTARELHIGCVQSRQFGVVHGDSQLARSDCTTFPAPLSAVQSISQTRNRFNGRRRWTSVDRCARDLTPLPLSRVRPSPSFNRYWRSCGL